MFGFKTEKYIIVGCGRFGSSLAGILSEQGNNVVVIDREKDAFRRLPPQFSGFEVIGDGTDPDTYWQARIQSEDTLIAATNSDNDNCMIAQMACKIYRLSMVFARLSDPTKDRILEGSQVKIIHPVTLSIMEFSRESGIELSQQGGRVI